MPQTDTLTRTDRCDRDQAEAAQVALRKRVKGSPDRELTLCGHHYQQHAPGLLADGWIVVKTDGMITMPEGL